VKRVNEQELQQSSAGQAAQSYIDFLKELAAVNKQVEIAAPLSGIVNAIERRLTGKPPVGILRNEPLFRALIIIGAWSALEAYIADFCKAAIKENPPLADDAPTKKLRNRLAEAEGDENEIYRVIESYCMNQSAPVIERIQLLLEYVGYGGNVADETAEAINGAKHIRNVWAHNAGIADNKFLEYGSKLGFQLGEKVVLNRSDTDYYTTALLKYGTTIMNRWIVAKGFIPPLHKFRPTRKPGRKPPTEG
jgi:hypothetical protein